MSKSKEHWIRYRSKQKPYSKLSRVLQRKYKIQSAIEYLNNETLSDEEKINRAIGALSALEYEDGKPVDAVELKVSQ